MGRGYFPRECCGGRKSRGDEDVDKKAQGRWIAEQLELFAIIVPVLCRAWLVSFEHPIDLIYIVTNGGGVEQ